MRRRLMAAAAIAPLCLVGFQSAQAQTAVTISSNTSTPVATATASNGGPADVTLASGQTFTIQTDGVTALTLNSNNALTNSGTITSKNVQNVTGMLITSGNGTLTNAGEINLTEDYTPSDSVNSDGVTEAPYAQGSGRIGIRLTGPFTGAIINAGGIDIQGNNSTGISIENTLTGTLASSGAINMAGDNSYAIHTTGAITGALSVSGAINVKGQNSVGIQTDGQIGGAFTISTSVQTTGFALTSRATGSSSVLQKIEATPADVELGGAAVAVTNSVLGGVYLVQAAPVTTVTTDTTTDADGDGIVDSAQVAGSLVTLGSAPALRIGGTSSAITLGNYGSTTDFSFGLIVGGSVTSTGVFDGVNSTGIDIGGGGGSVNLSGGIKVAGSVSAQANQANATAIHLESGTTGTNFWNFGTVSSSITSTLANQSTALQIDSGAAISGLVNYGVMTAAVSGDAGNATVVVDRNGSINSVTNYGSIVASITPTLAGEATTGTGIALDLSSNTTGVNLVQDFLSGATSGPVIVGDVLLGNGVNTVDIRSGSVTGKLDLGNAANSSLTLEGGSTYTGQLLYGGNSLALNVIGASNLIDKSATTVNVSNMNVSGGSTISVALDPAKNTSTVFNVSGVASFDSTTKIGASLLSTPSLSGQTFTIVKAGSLQVGGTDSSLLATLPYMFDASVRSNTAANTIAITVRTKSATELGFNKAETAAYGAIYAALPQDPGVQSTLITATTRASLINAYDQLLPNSSGDVFQTALGMSKAISRATSDRFDINTMPEDEDEDDFIVSGFWASEFYTGIDQNKLDNNAYHSAGLGVIGGYDFGGSGVTVAASSANITRPGQAGDSLNSVSSVEAGLYAAPRFGPLMLDGRVAVGYLKASNRRQLVASVVSGDLSTSTTVTRTADSDWSGYDFTGHVGAALQWDFGKHLFLQPRVYADVFHTHEDAYTERNGTSGYDFKVSQRDGTQTNGTASLVTGWKFGNTFVFSPQIEVGYDKVISGGPGNTTAQFVYGGPSFTLAPNQMTGAGMGRLTLRGDGNYVHFALQAGGEYASSYHTVDLKAVFRLTF